MRNDKWMKGEFYFKALLYIPTGLSGCWKLTEHYFASKEEAQEYCGSGKIVWPVEDLDGVIFAPDPEELT